MTTALPRAAAPAMAAALAALAPAAAGQAAARPPVQPPRLQHPLHLPLDRLPLVSAAAQQGLHLIFVSSAQLGKLRGEERQIQCSAVSMCASSAQFERSLTGLKSSVVSLTGIAGLRQYRHNSWV